MYNGIGLQTARGSGTNGYVQTNKFFVRPRTGKVTENTRGFEAGQGTAGISKQPNKDILEHDRKRQIELRLAILEDKLVDQGYTDAEVTQKLDEARKALEAAAATCEEDGGSTDKKLSDTQTHQIAARKEKQMETLRSALGISSSEVSNQKAEGIDDGDEPTFREMSDSDDEKPEHSFLDRDFRPRKRLVEDLKVETDDKKKGVIDSKSEKMEGERGNFDESKYRKRDASKGRRQHGDSSDTDSCSEHAKGAQKRNKNYRAHDSGDSDIDISKKNRTSKKRMKHRMHYSDDSDSGSSSDEAAGRSSKKDLEKYKKLHKRHASDDDDTVGRKNYRKEVRKYKRHDDSDDDERRISKKEVEKYKKSHKRHDSDDDSMSDGTEKGKQHRKTSRIYDSVAESDANEVEKKRSQLEKQRYRQGGSWVTEKGIPDMTDRWNGNNAVDENSESESDKVRKQQMEVGGRSRRQSDTTKDEKMEKYTSRRHDIDEDSDSSYYRKSSQMNMGVQKVDSTPDSSSDNISNNSYKSSIDSDYKHERDGRTKPKDKIMNEREGGAYDRGGRTSRGPIMEGKGHGSDAIGKDDQRRKSGHTTEKGLDSSRKVENLYLSQKDIVDRSGQEMVRGKRKFNDDNADEQPESKSRNRNMEHGVEKRDGYRKDSDTEPQSIGRAYKRKYDRRGDDFSGLVRSGGDRDEYTEPQRGSRRDDEVQRGNQREDKPWHRSTQEYEPQRVSRRDYEPRREGRRDSEQERGSRRDELQVQYRNKRDGNDYEEHERGSNDSTEEVRRRKKHTRDEGDLEHIKQTINNEEQRRGSRKILEEEGRGNRGYEGDRQIDSSKRARYVSYRSSERKRYDNDTHDDDRDRH